MSEFLSVFVGLDYHSSSVQVCVMDANGHMLLNRSCANEWRGFTAQWPHPDSQYEQT